MNFYQMLCWLFLGLYSTENSRAERLEIGAAKGIQGPTQPQLLTQICYQCQAGKSGPCYTDWQFT